MSQLDIRTGFKLRRLTEHLQQALPDAVLRKMEAWMEDITVQISPEDRGNGYNLGHVRYTAVFSFEGFPFRKTDPASVMANVAVWLCDNDPSRDECDLDDPTFDVEPESEDTAIMTFELEFSETMMLLPDDNGDVLWNERRWSLAPYDIWIAEEAEILEKDDA